MKKLIVLFVVLMSAVFSLPLYASDNNSGSMSFWEMLRKKIESFTPQKKIGVTNAVGGVRGAPSDANDLYWKGEASKKEMDGIELDEFKKALDFAAAGETQQAVNAFLEFTKRYPDSKLRKDAEQASAALVK